MQGLNIVADANIPGLDETFGRHGVLRRLPGRALDRALLADADVLLVRSVTPVGRDLLTDSQVRFVGSTTIGTDHLDAAWLDEQGIAWAAAPGCNADAAAQYTLAMLVLACRRLGRDVRKQRIGIIGRGHVGSRLQSLLDVLGVATQACDPPLAELGVPGLVDLKEALAQDVVSLHVPLTRDCPWPTWRMLDRERLARLPPGGLLLNAARGEVVDGGALYQALHTGRLHAALDTWPGEPEPDPALLAACTVATPHVAGYSLDGRLRGTAMVYAAWCAHAGVPEHERGAVAWPAPVAWRWPASGELEDLLLDTARVTEDDRGLRALVGVTDLAGGFDRLRRDYPWRRDHAGIVVHGADPEAAAWLVKLGFQVTA